MKNKLVLLTGVAIGYVLGTRAGREQYDKLREQAKALWSSPTVQQQVHAAQDAVREHGPTVAEAAKEKAGEAARTAKEKVRSSDNGTVGDGGGI